MTIKGWEGGTVPVYFVMKAQYNMQACLQFKRKNTQDSFFLLVIANALGMAPLLCKSLSGFWIMTEKNKKKNGL